MRFGLRATLLAPVVAALAAAFLASWAGASPLAALLFAALLSLPLALLAASERPAPAAESPSEAGEACVERLAEVSEALETGLLLVDPAGRLELANAAARRLLGLASAAPGRPVAELLGASLPATLLERALGGVPAALEWEPAEGPVPGIGLEARPLAAGGALLLARDLSAPRRMAASGRDLVANVSHELKTPLTAIRGAAETLRDGALAEPEAAGRFTASILEQCERLEVLLGDLLTLSHLEGSAPRPRRRPVDLAVLAREALELLRPMAAGKEVGLELASEDELHVAGDANALERMLVNLLENAIKYNRPGGAARLRLGRAGREVRIEVEDTGIGIPEASLERIFERFYRVDKGRSRGQGGTGLGLAIVKHVVRSHGGRVEVSSELGRGSTFTLHLPAAGAGRPAAAEPARTRGGI